MGPHLKTQPKKITTNKPYFQRSAFNDDTRDTLPKGGGGAVSLEWGTLPHTLANPESWVQSSSLDY